MRRVRVLCLIRYYLPGYKGGGPLRSIQSLAAHLGQNAEFKIITTDRDYGDAQPYQDIVEGQWNPVEEADVYYLSTIHGSWMRLIELIKATPHDVLYLQSFFDPIFTVLPLVARLMGKLPNEHILIAPRGEFSSGALALKRWKKVPYIIATKKIGLYEGVTWHASTKYEHEDICRVFQYDKNRVFVAGNIVIAPDLPSIGPSGNFRPATPRSDGTLKICFLSRLTPKKNLDFALRILGRVKTPVVFDIYGPKEDEKYWNKCEALIGRLEWPVVACYRGPVRHDQIANVFRSYDLFFFPTLGENFGHVIVESMLAGTPVLISDTTPWQDLENAGVGWNLPLADEEGFVSAILKVASMEPEERSQWRDRVDSYARNICEDPVAVHANRELISRFQIRGGLASTDKAPGVVDR